MNNDLIPTGCSMTAVPVRAIFNTGAVHRACTFETPVGEVTVWVDAKTLAKIFADDGTRWAIALMELAR